MLSSTATTSTAANRHSITRQNSFTRMLSFPKQSVSLLDGNGGNGGNGGNVGGHTWNTDTIDIDPIALQKFVTLTLYDVVVVVTTKANGRGKGQKDVSTTGTTTNMKPLLNNLCDLVDNLADHYMEYNNKLCNFHEQQTCTHCSKKRLYDICTSLEMIVQSEAVASSLLMSPAITAEIHSFIGLLKSKQGNFTGAVQSFLKVVWIQNKDDQNSNSNSNRAKAWQMAMTKHRLGMSYGRNGQFDDAITVLEKTVQEYEKHHSHCPNQAGSKKLIRHARTSLANFREAKKLAESTITTCSKSGNGTSSTITATSKSSGSRRSSGINVMVPSRTNSFKSSKDKLNRSKTADDVTASSMPPSILRNKKTRETN